MAEERWVDIEDPREQFEAAFGIKLQEWQWDYIQHLQRGERLVPKGKHGSQWIHDDRLDKDYDLNEVTILREVTPLDLIPIKEPRSFVDEEE